MEDRMVPRMMNKTAGNMLKSWCQKKGVAVKTKTRVTGVKNSNRGGLTVHLNKGRPVKAALVVVATGVQSNTGFLKGSGVRKQDGGVAVDDHLQSSVDGIYAAGDVACGPDFSGGWAVHAIQPTAAEHGRIAAINMAGGDAKYQGSLIMNVLDTAGLISASFGNWPGVKGGDIAETVDKGHFRYTRLAFEDDRLIGALTLGLTEHVGVIRGLIQSRISLGPWKKKLIANPSSVMEAYVALSPAAA